MPNGDMICLTSKGICVRLDATGKEIKSFNVPQFTSSGIVLSSVGNIDVTPKGHVVLMQNDTKVAEFDSEGRLIWQANVAGNRANRLANGHTLVASENTGVVELDATGKPVWKYEPPPGYQAVRARPGGDVEKPVPVNNVPPANAEFGGIEPKVVAAWEKAGAQFILTSNAALAPAKKKAADSDIYPTFKFSTATAKGVIAALPPPAAPFGVSFIGAKGKGNPVSEVPVTELAALKQLRSLDLKGAGLTDADLKTLGAMKQLESLHIGINAVTDAGLKELTGIQELHTLGLGNTNITDAGLKELAKLKQLRQLTLTGAPVSGTGVAELQKALPNLTILGPVGKAK
jgi:hypothetical protein